MQLQQNQGIKHLFTVLMITVLSFGIINVNSIRVFAQAPGVIVRIDSDTMWLMSDSPHVLTGPLLVNQGVTLTIQAGSVVDLNGYELRVNGTLRAIGTLNEQISCNDGKITFTEYSNPWNQQTGTGSRIQFAVFDSVEIIENVPVSINDNTLGSDDVWTEEDSPITLSGQVIVDEGKVLTINPGVTVNLNGYNLVVKGTLLVLGTDSNKVYFNDEKKVGEIRFTEFSAGWDEQLGFGSRLEYAVLSTVQIKSEVSLKMSHCEIQEQVQVAGESVIMDNEINGLSISGGSVTVSNNNIEKINTCYGAPKIFGNNIKLFVGRGGSPVIRDNTIDEIGHLTVDYEGTTINYFSVDSFEITNNLINGGVYINCDSGTFAGNTIIGRNQSYTYPYYDYSIHSALYYMYMPAQEVTRHILSDGIVVNGDASIIGNQISGCYKGISGGKIVQGNFLSGNNEAIVVTQNAIIQQNNITNSDTAIIVNSFAEIKNNTITNARIGIRLNFQAIINYNNIEGCSNTSIYLAVNSVNIDAKNNWWGTTDPETINLKIHDSTYSFDLGTVTFEPFLINSNSQVLSSENLDQSVFNIPEFTSAIILLFTIVGAFVVFYCKHKINLTQKHQKGSQVCATY